MATRQRTQQTEQAEKTDFRQAFTDQVVAAIESGQKLPWEKPWVARSSPSNAVSGKEYNGMNRLMLGMHMLDKGYTDPRFLTFKQALDLGGAVNKGEKGVQIERWDEKPFWKRHDVEIRLGGAPVEVKSVDAQGVHLSGGQTVSKDRLTVTLEQRTNAGVLSRDHSWQQAEKSLNLLVGRAYTVFNVEQCKDLKLEPLPQRPAITPEARLEHIQNAMREMTGLQFATGSAAMYIPPRDTVVTPVPSAFKSLGDYQSTMLHEIGHATGAEKRLNRPTLTEPAKFGSQTYAREELRAELFSAFAAMETGITRARDEQHHAYLQSWAETLKKDKNEVFRAAADAAKAVDYVVAQEQAYDLKIDAIHRAVNGLEKITPDQIRPGLDLVDKEDRMSRVQDVQRTPAGLTITTEQDLDTGTRFHRGYRDGDEILATTLSLNLKDPEQAIRAEPQQGKLKTIEIDAPAHWASALVNRDDSGLEASEAARVKDWVKKQGVGWPVSASETFTGRHEGLLTGMATYTFLVPEKAIGPSVAGGVDPGKADPLKQPHEMTFAEFSQTAAAQKLGPNHGREWQIMRGNQFMGFAEGPTAEDALRMMHKNKVSNALYDHLPDAVRPPDMEPASFPPKRVLDEYPDLQKQFAPVIEEHRQMLAKEDRKASEYQVMKQAERLERIEQTRRATGTFKELLPGDESGRSVMHMTRAGVDVAVSVPEGVGKDLRPGMPIKLRYDPKQGVQIEAGKAPAKDRALSR